MELNLSTDLLVLEMEDDEQAWFLNPANNDKHRLIQFLDYLLALEQRQSSQKLFDLVNLLHMEKAWLFLESWPLHKTIKLLQVYSSDVQQNIEDLVVQLQEYQHKTPFLEQEVSIKDSEITHLDGFKQQFYIKQQELIQLKQEHYQALRGNQTLKDQVEALVKEVIVRSDAQKNLESANRLVMELKGEIEELNQSLFREKQLRVAAESVLAEQVECPQESSDEEAATPNPMVQAQKDKNKQLRQRFIKQQLDNQQLQSYVDSLKDDLSKMLDKDKEQSVALIQCRALIERQDQTTAGLQLEIAKLRRANQILESGRLVAKGLDESLDKQIQEWQPSQQQRSRKLFDRSMAEQSMMSICRDNMQMVEEQSMDHSLMAEKVSPGNLQMSILNESIASEMSCYNTEDYDMLDARNNTLNKFVQNLEGDSYSEELVFSSECEVYHDGRQLKCVLLGANGLFQVLYSESKIILYEPFSQSDLAAFIMSPEYVSIGAFKFKECWKTGRSHIILSVAKMPVLISYMQQKEHFVRTEFQSAFQLQTEHGFQTFEFEKVAGNKAEVRQGCVNSLMQGMLYQKRDSKWFKSFWKTVTLDTKDVWMQKFYVLTNVGLLVFDNKNLTKPSRVIPLFETRLVSGRSKQIDKRDHTFGLQLKSGELVLLAAPDRLVFQAWLAALQSVIQQVKRNPTEFNLT